MKYILFTLGLVALLSVQVVTAAPISIGGDGGATYGGALDGAGDIVIIGNTQVAVESEAPSETYDLSLSTFDFFAAPGTANRTARPFIASFSGGAVNDFNNYDVLAVGDPVTVTGAQVNSSVSVFFQAAEETVTVNNGETIVGGFEAIGALPIGFGGGAALDSRIILQGDVDEATDVTVTGTNWSGNNGVNNRIYDFQVNLEPQVAVPEPTSLASFTIVGLLAFFGYVGWRRRRRS